MAKIEPPDAFVIACFDDTGLEAARCVTSAPVVGIGEAAFQHREPDRREIQRRHDAFALDCPDRTEPRQIWLRSRARATHKENDEWLAAHPNVTFRFTPNIGLLAQPDRDLVRHPDPQGPPRAPASTTSRSSPKPSRHSATSGMRRPDPFVWGKPDVRGSQIKNTIAN